MERAMQEAAAPRRAGFLENRPWAFHLCLWLGIALLAVAAYAAFDAAAAALNIVELVGSIEAGMFGLILIALAGAIGILEDIRAWTEYGARRSGPLS